MVEALTDNVTWRDVVICDGVFAEAYQANSLGEVWSKDRVVTYKNGTQHFYKGKKLKQSLNKCYPKVRLQYNGYDTVKPVHQIISTSFPEICGKQSPGLQVDHLDGNPSNNRPENLNYKTSKENNNNPITLKRKSEAMTNRKDQSKPVIQFAKDGTIINEYPSVKEAERQTGVRQSNISSCCICKNGQQFAGCFRWMYKEEWEKKKGTTVLQSPASKAS